MKTLYPLLGLSLLLSGCSGVSLNYQLANLIPGASQSNANQQLSSTQELNSLANLNIKARVQADLSTLQNLSLRLTLKHLTDPTMNREIVVNAQSFLANPSLFLADLSPGEAELTVELMDAQLAVLSLVSKALLLAGNAQQDFDFVLLPGVSNAGLAGFPSLSLVSTGGLLIPGSVLPQAPTTPPQTLTPGTPSPGLPASGNGDSGNPAPLDLKIKVLETSANSILTIWEKPPGLDIIGYRILLNGQVIEANHPVANYRFNNLVPGNDYQLEVLPILKDGTVLPAQPLSQRTANGSSGGGGGGGGGSSSGGGTTVTPPVNQPPVIQSLTPGKTTLNGLGYPVQLTAVATDDQVLTNASYTWSCNNCGDASFSQTNSPQVIWNAPSTAGDYTIQVSVSDGVNPPVTKTQVIKVKHQTATVTVIGDYK